MDCENDGGANVGFNVVDNVLNSNNFLSNSISTKESTKFPAPSPDKLQSAVSNGGTNLFQDECSENNYDSGFSNDKQISVSNNNVNTEMNKLDTDSGNDSTLDPPIYHEPCERTAKEKYLDNVNEQHPNTAQRSHKCEINLNNENPLVDFKEKVVANGELSKHELEITQFDNSSKLAGHENELLTNSVTESGNSVIEHSLAGEVGGKAVKDENQTSFDSGTNGQSVDTLAPPENIFECISDEEEVYLEVDEIDGSDLAESDIEESSQIVADCTIEESDQASGVESKVGNGEESSQIVADCEKTIDTLIEGIDQVNSDCKFPDIDTGVPMVSAGGPIDLGSKSFDEGNGMLMISADEAISAEESQEESMFEEEIFEEMEEYVDDEVISEKEGEVDDQVISEMSNKVDDEAIAKDQTEVEGKEMVDVDERVYSSTSVQSLGSTKNEMLKNESESKLHARNLPLALGNECSDGLKNCAKEDNKSNEAQMGVNDLKVYNIGLSVDEINKKLTIQCNKSMDFENSLEEDQSVIKDNDVEMSGTSYPKDPNIVLKPLKDNSIDGNNEEENECMAADSSIEELCVIDEDDDISEEPMNVSSENNESYPEDPNIVLKAKRLQNNSINEIKSTKEENKCIVEEPLNEELFVVDESDSISEKPMNVSSENKEFVTTDDNKKQKNLIDSNPEEKIKDRINIENATSVLDPKVSNESVSDCSVKNQIERKETENNTVRESPQKLLDGLDDEFESLIEEFAVKECADENTNQTTPIDKPESSKRETVMLDSDDEIEVIMEDFKAADSDDDCLIVEDTSNVINVEKDSSKNKRNTDIVAVDVSDKTESTILQNENLENEKAKLNSNSMLEETSQCETTQRNRIESIPFISDSPLLMGGSYETTGSFESSQLERMSSQLDKVTEENSCDVMMNSLLDKIELDVAAKTNCSDKLKSTSGAETKDNSKNAGVGCSNEGNIEMDELIINSTDVCTKEDHRKRTFDEVESSYSPEMNKKLKQDEISIEIPYDSNSTIQQSIRGKALELVPQENAFKFKTTNKILDKIVKRILAKSIEDIAPISYKNNKKTMDESEEMCQLFTEDLQLFNAQLTSLLADQDEKFHKSNFTPKEVHNRTVGVNVKIFLRDLDFPNHAPSTAHTKPNSFTSKGTSSASNIRSPAPSPMIPSRPNTTVSSRPLIQSNQAGNPLASVHPGQVRPVSRAVAPIVRPQTSTISPSSVAIPGLTGNQNVLMPMTVFQIRPNSGNPPIFTSATQLPTGRSVFPSSIRHATGGPRTVAYLMPANSSQLTTFTGRNSLPGTSFLAAPNQRLQTFVVRMTNSGHVPPIGSIVTSTPRLPAPANTLVNTNTITTATSNNGLVLFPRPTTQHPAPFPMPPVQSYNPKLKLIPPKPTLKGARAPQPQTGIILSWNMNVQSSHSEISNYQLFAYQETNAPVTSALWKKVGDVKALPLPMACTLTQFSDGNRYYFTVRASDCHGRLGPFSDPVSILYTKPDDTQVSKK